jgi:uncharacterized coiled-coil DUF342 family protein
VVRDVYSDGSGSSTRIAAATAPAPKDGSDEPIVPNQDSNFNTLLEFKKTLLEEQKTGEKSIESLNKKIEDTKRQIDDARILLEELRIKLKEINEQKDVELPKFTELKTTMLEARDQMKSLDDRAASPASKVRKERHDIISLTRALEQIEHDIQTRKLSKDEERKLVSKSREIATKLHALKIIYKKEDKYRSISSQYESLKAKMNKLFEQRAEFGEKIGKLKTRLDVLLNLRESLYEDRRKNIRAARETGAKLEMVDTQLNAIEFKKARAHAIDQRQRRRYRNNTRRDNRYEAFQERNKRSKENQERWNTLKEAALKKMESGEKLTFDEMKLIFGDHGSPE